MPHILALCSGESRQIIQAQLGKTRVKAHYVGVLDELEQYVKTERVEAIVADLFDAKGRSVAPALRTMRPAFPEVKLILSFEPSPAALDDVLEAAMSDAPFAFVARPFNDLGLLMPPLLAWRSARSPSAAGSLVTRLAPQVRTTATRRCITLGAVSPAHRMSLGEIARACGTRSGTLYRQLQRLVPPRLLLNALGWVQASYMLTALHWKARHIATYFGYRRPAMLIELLADYVESGLWRFGLDSGVDEVAAKQAAWLEGDDALWPHRRRFRARAKRELTAALDGTDYFDSPDDSWLSKYRRAQITAPILSMVGAGKAPIEIVRYLWTRHDITLGHLYRSVMQLTHAAHAGGFIEED